MKKNKPYSEFLDKHLINVEQDNTQDKQVSSQQNELQYLKNALDHHNLNGYTIHQNYSSDRRRKIGEYFLVDDKGTSLTGYWNYEQLTHFIMGYGKAYNKFKN